MCEVTRVNLHFGRATADAAGVLDPPRRLGHGHRGHLELRRELRGGVFSAGGAAALRG